MSKAVINPEAVNSLSDAIANVKDRTISPQTLSSIDLNTVTTTGVYLLGGNITNSPYGNYGYLIVIAQGTDIVQYYTNSNSAGTYVRTKYSGTWGSWNELAIANKKIVQAANASGQPDATGLYRLYVNPSNHVATIFDGNGTRLGYFTMNN